MRSIRLAGLVLGLAALVASAQRVSAQVAEPWVTTDQTVDCSSLETIVRDVIKPGMTDEQKALALYHFFRQRVFHYKNLPESRIPLKTLNVMGNTLCGSQGTCMKGLLEAAGLKARVVCHTDGSHTFYEAFYDGAWHGFDTFTNFYVYTKGDKPHIASFEEMQKDPSIVKDAVAEKRAPPGLCHCGDNPMAFASGFKVLNYEPSKSDWNVKAYGLRKGEEIVRSWWPEGKPLPGSFSGKQVGPMHTCGGKDRDAEPFLFKFWEPYNIKNWSGVSNSFRHYTNGRMNYSPNLTNDDYKDGLLSEKGVKPGADGLSGEGEWVFPVKCSFYITGGELAFEATCAGEGDAVETAVSVDGKTWVPVVTGKDTGKKEYKGAFDQAVAKAATGRHDYQVKFTFKGKAVLHKMLLQTIFSHNAMAAPHLMPGKNKVTLTAASTADLKATPLTVIYRYKDAPKWDGEVKTVEKTSDANPFVFEVELPASDKLPQMQDLTIRCGTLAWTPAPAPAIQTAVAKPPAAPAAK